ncbi:GVIN1 GTPase, partial [Amia calva]|nr:GVIN1 GTPase [Amia calva]
GQCLKELLCQLGIEHLYPGKLTLNSLLEISQKSVTDVKVQSLRDLPWLFLKKLLMVNTEARCLTHNSDEENMQQMLADVNSLKSLPDLYGAEDNVVNPLDVIVTVFLCADSFLRQELMLKMSMCQFSVPLLLPQGSGGPCTLMLWALRDVLKEWRPHSLAETQGFEEDCIICAEMPLISFVRLGDCSLSKSHVLNKVLSKPQENHNFFIHRDMECGDVPRRVSSGLVEISWYLPCGKKNLDIFPEPMAIANLRGDISSYEQQFRFLMETSTVVFAFLDSVQEEEHKLLVSFENISSKLYLVVNSKKQTQQQDLATITKLSAELKLEPKQILFKTEKVNEAKFANILSTTIKNIVQNNCKKFNLQDTRATADELGIPVDEVHDTTCCSNAEMRAEEIIKGIRVHIVTQYKAKQLPLQGELWKKLAKLEKEECRLRDAGDQRLEVYKSQLQQEKQDLREKQSKYKLTKAMQHFIENVSSPDRLERAFYLKWLRMKLDVLSRRQLSSLRNRCNEQLRKTTQDREAIAQLDQQLLDCSLGIEHFMREMGQIYEASLCSSGKGTPQVLKLPAVAADLLLDGFPLELVDGDASNIPVRWVRDVLMELHRKVGENSRLLVMAVLGVQSTGKSTLLNTMFGVKFSVSSGRCTRGAYMLFLRVTEDMKEELGCDFLLLIDTEGLKSAQLAQLEDSYEHDNELATLVTGLSDITIVNIAMENSSEMRDILQIVVHAFLRMSEVGKRPRCQFVHQNVAGVSAKHKTMTDRKHLLEQLNEMTKIAADMEKHSTVNKFTDVLDYDVEKNNWYIPGLWHGTPPMAPVNTGYSEAVYEFKQKMFAVLKSCKDEKPLAKIPEFLEWMSSLWKAVKYENFIFSFRNTLVADAYNNLCTEFSEWEWTFRKHIYSWLVRAEDRISNFQADDENPHENSSMETLFIDLKSEVSLELTSAENTMMDKLKEYYKRKERHISLVEKYKADFMNCVRSLQTEAENTVLNKLRNAMEIHKGMTEVKEIHSKYTSLIKQRVRSLLDHCKNSNTPLSEEQLKDEFENMWRDTVSNLSFPALQQKDIHAVVLHQLRNNLQRCGSSIREKLNNINDLIQCVDEEFKVNPKHISFWNKFKHFFAQNDMKAQAQKMANAIIQRCQEFISEKVKSGTDFNEIYTTELLQMTGDSLKNHLLKLNSLFELDLKVHICAFAVKAFVQMHEHFLREKDPRRQLERFKTQFFSDFQNQYHNKDQCQRKAQDFTDLCLRPAVTEYVQRALGIEIVDKILTSGQSLEYSSRSFFQFTILKELLEKDDFQYYASYILTYETFVKDWILNQIVEHFSRDASIGDLRVRRLESIVAKVEQAIERARGGLLMDGDNNATGFINELCRTLSSDLPIPRDAVGGTLFQITAKRESFAQSLSDSVKEMKISLLGEFSAVEDIKETLASLSFRPQDELFNRVFGCGKQCPFCKVPCEAGGKDHRVHHASVHRPQGLGCFKSVCDNKLAEMICTSQVCNENMFKTSVTGGIPHSYKDYLKVYPDWNIPPDVSIEASDYWKYVLVRYNQLFAERFIAEPADVPEEWRRITQEKALESLKVSFNIR